MIYFIVSIVGLVLSFFFAGSETAFITTNRIRFEIWLRQKRKSALAAKNYFENPEIFLSTTLVGNNLANILTSSYATVYLIEYIEQTYAWLIITFTLLFFGEILPKVIFRSYANILILRLIYVVRFFHYILRPLILMAQHISTLTLKMMNVKKEVNENLLDKKDIEVLINEARISGIVDRDGQRIITNVLDLPKRLVREAMIPRTSINAIDYKRGIQGINKIISRSGNTKIPVYRGSIDNIIGVVFLYDLLAGSQSIDEIIKPVQYIPENKKCNEMLKEFRESNTSIAIVIDEYGGTAGIVTVEDLVEELFGEIEEKDLRSKAGIRPLNKNTFQIRSEVTTEYIEEEFGISIPAGTYETIGGYFIARIGHIPAVGEMVETDKFRLIITRADSKRIIEMRLVVKSS